MNISQKIRKLRTEKKLTLAQVGEHLGLKGQSISSYESGATPPMDKLILLAELFEVKPEYFLSDNENLTVKSQNTPESTIDYQRSMIDKLMEEKNRLLDIIDRLTANRNFPKADEYSALGDFYMSSEFIGLAS